MYNSKCRCGSGGTGRRARLRGVWFYRTGSIPVSRTKRRGRVPWTLPLFVFGAGWGSPSCGAARTPQGGMGIEGSIPVESHTRWLSGIKPFANSLLCRLPSPKTLINRFRLVTRLPHQKDDGKWYVFHRLFLSIAKAMAYHHALACISSPKVHIINRRLYRFRNDDIPRTALRMICNSSRIDDIQGFALIVLRIYSIIY